MEKRDSIEKELSNVLKDRTHGASYLAKRLSRDLKRLLEYWESENEIREGLEITLNLLKQYHPDLLLLQNLVAEMLAATQVTPHLTKKETDQLLDQFLEREHTTIDLLAKFLSEKEEQQFLTISHSGTIFKGLLKAFFSSKTKPLIIVQESIPGGEGIVMAKQLKIAGFPVAVITDTAVNLIKWSSGAVLVGFDQMDDRFLINKAGTKSLVLSIKHKQFPVVVAGSTNKVVEKINLDRYKVASDQLIFYDSGDFPCYWPSDARLSRFAPIFETVELSLIDTIITDCGIQSRDNWVKCYQKIMRKRTLKKDD